MVDQEGLSQTAIAKELGVSQRTISDWLSTNGCDGKEVIIAKMGNVSNNCLSVRTIPHYLVVCQATQAIMAQTPIIGNNGLAIATHSCYLVVCQSVAA